MTRKFILLLILLSGINSCNNEQVSLIPLDTVIIFETTNNTYENSKVELQTQLGANENGDTLTLQIDINNKSADTVRISTSEIQLTNSKNLRCNVIPSDYKLASVYPKSKSTIRVKFNPVNNLYLYKKTSTLGTIDSAYTLNGDLCFLNSESIFNISVDFRLNENTNKSFNAKRQCEANTVFYIIGGREKIRQTITKHYSQLKIPIENHDGHDHKAIGEAEIIHPLSIEILETEIMIQGLVLKLNFFQTDSVLQLYAKIVNHGELELLIDTSKISLILDQEKLRLVPYNLFTVAPTNYKGQYIVRKSGRLSFYCTSIVDISADFDLCLEGFKYTILDKNVFPSCIPFKELQELN